MTAIGTVETKRGGDSLRLRHRHFRMRQVGGRIVFGNVLRNDGILYFVVKQESKLFLPKTGSHSSADSKTMAVTRQKARLLAR